MSTDIDLLQGIVVLGVTIDGDDVYADVYGSEANVCGSVRFTFPDPEERREKAALLEAWAEQSTPLTLIETSTSIALQDDEAVFRAQAEPRS